MNMQQLRAFLWLHWRLRVNQLKRTGTANTVILAILAVAAVFFAICLFVILFLAALFVMPTVSASMVLYVWDGLIAAFLFCWTIALLTELQRSEMVGLDKFLHLPITLAGAFLVNYLSSLVSLTLLVFVPALVGLSFGLVFARGPLWLLLLPLLAAFLLMVTAVTYQFQGWLASLMVNQRRRRTIIVLVTAAFILICQLPSLLTVWRQPRQQPAEAGAALSNQQTELQRALSAGEITEAEYRRRLKEVIRQREVQVEPTRQTWEEFEGTARLLNVLLPPGWLALGAMSLAEGQVVPALLGTFGLTLLGAASLSRAYRTTLRLYTGQFTSGKRRRPVPVAVPIRTPSAASLLEWELPWLSEHAAAIAVASFRSLTRSPEVKMMLLTPVILLLVFLAPLLRGRTDLPQAIPPLLAFAAMALVLLTMFQIVGNQFGFDRSGFRLFVLCAAQRRDILLGKNLAFAPLCLGFGTAAVCVLAAIYRMRVSYFLAALPQLLSMYLLFCLLANLLSLLAPMAVASGSFKPSMKGIPLLLNLAFVFLFPLALAPTLAPLGVQVILEYVGWARGIPVCLLLSLSECVAVWYLYRLVLTWQGSLLQARELKILDAVTRKAE